MGGQQGRQVQIVCVAGTEDAKPRSPRLRVADERGREESSMLGKRVPLVPARRVHDNLTQAESLHDRTHLALHSTNGRHPRRPRKDGRPVESYRRSPASPSAVVPDAHHQTAPSLSHAPVPVSLSPACLPKPHIRSSSAQPLDYAAAFSTYFYLESAPRGTENLRTARSAPLRRRSSHDGCFPAGHRLHPSVWGRPQLGLYVGSVRLDLPGETGRLVTQAVPQPGQLLAQLRVGRPTRDANVGRGLGS